MLVVSRNKEVKKLLLDATIEFIMDDKILGNLVSLARKFNENGSEHELKELLVKCGARRRATRMYTYPMDR